MKQVSENNFTRTENNHIFYLNGTKSLIEEIVAQEIFVAKKVFKKENGKKFFHISKKIITEKRKKIEYPLTVITPKELAKFREYCRPTFVLKINDFLYETKIPKSMCLVSCSTLGKHQCTVSRSTVCSRLSAASDEKGGCQKVRDGAKSIERYSWITKGYETFNTLHDVLAVISCNHYKCAQKN